MKTNSMILGAAVLMLATACSNDEVVKVAENSAAIGFSSFVNNSTRGDYSSTTLPADMKVYAMSERAASGTDAAVAPYAVFEGTIVSNTSGAWTYSPVRYWAIGNSYNFAAVAPADAATVEQNGEGMNVGGISKITFVNDGTEDLLFNDQPVAAGTAASDYGTVSFTMEHLLSRVQFQFDCEMPDAYEIKVSNLTITDALTDGEITGGELVKTKADRRWTADEAKTKEFAFTTSSEYTSENVKSNHKYVLPAGLHAYNATFTIALREKGTNVVISDKLNHTVTLPAIDFTPGYVYTFKATVNKDNVDPNPDEPILKPIEFDVVAVDGWENGEDKEILPQPEPEEGSENAGE